MIITNINKLREPVPVTDFIDNEAELISTSLFDTLNREGGLGLSANQIGLTDTRVCVIKVTEPFYLVNPVIIERSEELYTYFESCISIPRTRKKPIKTERNLWVKVQADNLPSEIMFGPDDLESWSDNSANFWKDAGFLQAVVVQHEIDHLDGITIRDRRYASDGIEPVNQYERNESVMFFNPTTGDVEFMKFKFGKELLENGWVIK